jgi:hypothetical protein
MKKENIFRNGMKCEQIYNKAKFSMLEDKNKLKNA